MPIIGGFELLNILKNDKKLANIPVIAYSASVMKDQKDRILESKFAGLLVKPVLVTELFFELMKHLKHRTNRLPDNHGSAEEVRGSHKISDLPGLKKSLETGFKDTCRAFEVIQPIDEVREFGNNLILLGNSHDSVVIKEYGEELVRASDNFNIDAILKLIRSYEEVITNL